MYAGKDYCRQGGRESGRAEGRERECVGWKGCENLRRYRGRMVRHCNGWIEGKNRRGWKVGKRNGTRIKGGRTSQIGLNKLFFFSSLLFYSFMLVFSPYYSFMCTYYSQLFS